MSNKHATADDGTKALARLGILRSCKYCEATMPAFSKRRFYCSDNCAAGAKSRKDDVRKRRAKEERKAKEIEATHSDGRPTPRSRLGPTCNCHIVPAWPHKFSNEMVCHDCGITWEDNQSWDPETGLGLFRCTPEGEERAVRERATKEAASERKKARRKIADDERKTNETSISDQG